MKNLLRISIVLCSYFALRTHYGGGRIGTRNRPRDVDLRQRDDSRWRVQLQRRHLHE